MQPEASVRTIAETTRINRGSVFESIKSLLAAGLVAQTLRGKRVVYRAKDPEVLYEIINEKHQELARAQASVEAYAANFQGQASNPELFHFASFYRDDEGLAAILRDVLKTCRKTGVSHYRIISSPRVSAYLYNNFPHFTQERIRLGLSISVLRQGAALRPGGGLSSSRYLPNTTADSGCYTLIYGHKVAIITIGDFNQTSGLIVDDPAFASIQEQLFD